MPYQLQNATGLFSRHLSCQTTGTFYEWFTPWMSCDGVDNIRAVLKAKNASANLAWQLVVQYAAIRVDNPGSATTLAAAQTANGEYNPGDISVATDMGNNRFFRLGIAYGATAGQQGDLTLQASWKQVGTDLGTAQATLALSDSSNRYEAITAWIPATFMSKVKVAFVVNSITPSNGNFKYRLAVQTAATTTAQPTAWTDLEQAFQQPGNGTNYSEHHTGEIAVTTSDMWFRLAICYTQAGGVDSNYSAIVNAACSCR